MDKLTMVNSYSRKRVDNRTIDMPVKLYKFLNILKFSRFVFMNFISLYK